MWKLPAAYFSGVRVREFTDVACSVSVPYKWFSQNPFRSTYFACLAMAAEMSSGMLALAQVYERKPAVSMLVVKLEAQYHKKATSSTLFTCSDGAGFAAAIEQAVATGEGVEFDSHSVGRNAKGELIAEFWIRWSFKAKS